MIEEKQRSGMRENIYNVTMQPFRVVQKRLTVLHFFDEYHHLQERLVFGSGLSLGHACSKSCQVKAALSAGPQE